MTEMPIQSRKSKYGSSPILSYSEKEGPCEYKLKKASNIKKKKNFPEKNVWKMVCVFLSILSERFGGPYLNPKR